MLTNKQKHTFARRWRHYLESLIYVECLAHGIKTMPVLEIADDMQCYQRPGLIHIGVGMCQASNAEELFKQVHYLLGHEVQHMLSTTDKDWNAAHKLCFRNACQRLSVKVFGKARRLARDSDYDNFFEELAKKGIFVNQDLLITYANFILNTIEDGRIENIRPKNHPGFGDYKKVFRGAMWLEDDFHDESFYKPDPDDLSELDELKMLLGQIYYLATLGIFQKGFLDAYGGTDAQKLVETYIPEIARGVLGKTCKAGMDHGRNIFDRLLDRVLDACVLDANNAKQVQKFLERMLDKMLSEAENQQPSATPNNEEQGDGTPAESLFGESDLELEVTEEEYEQMKEDAGDDTEGTPSVKIKVKDDSEDDDAEEATAGSGNSADADGDSDSDSEDASPDGNPASAGSEGDGEDSSQTSSADANGDSDSKTNNEESSEKECDSSCEEYKTESAAGSEEEAGKEADSNAGSGDSTDSEETMDASKQNGIADTPDENERMLNNRDEGNAGSKKSGDDLKDRIREEMRRAAQNLKAEFELAEADAKLDEKFSKAAEEFKPVPPEEFDISKVDEAYSYDVEFIESTREYVPVGRLPLELEHKGRSLDRTIDRIIKNKEDPDQRFLTSGKLDTKRLASLATDDPLHIYMKKGQPVKTDVACFLLMDNSGSMGNGPGSTRFACCNAFAVLEEGFKKHMPLKIAAFDAQNDYSVSHEIIKEFDEVAVPNLSFNFRDLGRGGWGNKDGYSIRVATRQLMARPEKDKVLIIASDGFPTEYRRGYSEGCADVKAAVAEARNAGIRTIGMYMYHDQCESDFAKYSSMYGPEIIFASLDEIEESLTRILKKYF